MSDSQGTKTPGRPWHLWLIGVIYARAMSKKGVLT